MICVLTFKYNLVIKLLFSGLQDFSLRLQSSGAHLQILFLPASIPILYFSWNGLNSQWIGDAMSAQAWKKFALKKSSVEAQQAMRNQVIIDFFFFPIKETEEMFLETERHNVIDVDMLNLDIFESFSKSSEDMKSEFPLG